MIEEVRQRLAAQGDEATLVLTSDHWLRERELWSAMYEQQRGPGSGQAGKSSDERVPMIVWFSGNAPAVQHPSPISALATRNLVLALQDGSVRSPQDVARFFAQQPAPVPPRSGGAGVH
jgi:hypothetical protein